MPQRSVASNYTFEQQRTEINLLAADFWSQKATVDGASSTYLKHDGSNDFTGGTLAVPAAFTINSNSGAGTVTIAGNLQVDGTTTTVNSATMDVVDKNITIAKGSANDAAANGAGITVDSPSNASLNFIDSDDAWVSSIGLKATTFLKGPYGQFTGSGTPATGMGVEVNAPDSNTGQITSYDRTNSAYKDLRIKGSSVGVYTGTTNALIGTFNSTGLTLHGGAPASNPLLVTGNYDGSNPTVDIQTWQRIGGAVQAKMIYKDASTDMHFGTDTGHTFNLMTGGSDRIKIASNSAATSIGGVMAFNAMLTVQGDVSGSLLSLKAAENTNRFNVSGTDGNDVEVNLYDKDGTQRGILVGGATEFAIKAPNNASPLKFYTNDGSNTLERLCIRGSGVIASNNSTGAVLELTRTATNTSGLCGKLVFGNSDWDSSMASIQSYQDGANDNASLRFYTQASAAGGEQEALRITSGGDIKIPGGGYLDFYGSRSTYRHTGSYGEFKNPTGDFYCSVGNDYKFGNGDFSIEYLTIKKDTGYVGIGIDTPDKTGIQNNVSVLQIDSGDGAELILGNSTSQNVSVNHVGAIAFKNIDNSTGAAPHYCGIRSNCTDTSGNMNLKFYGGATAFEADTPHMLIDSVGRVGVGVNPTARFHVSSAYNETPVKIAGGAHNGYSSPLQVTAANGDMRLEVSADNGVQFTRGPVGGAEHIGNSPDMWQKIGIWKGASVDGAARCKITVMGTDTHDSNGNVAGETIIYLAFGANHVLKGYYYSTSGQYPGLAGVAWKYDDTDSSNKKVEIWVKYDSAYGMTQCYADCSTGLFEGANINSGDTNVPAGCTELESYFNIRTATGGTNYERLRIIADGRTGICTPDARFGQGNSASSNQMYQNTPKLGVEGSIVIGNLSPTDTDVRELAFYRRGNAAAGSQISTHKMGRIAWYGSSNDSSFPDKAWSLECTPNGADWTAGTSRRGYLSFVNHDGEHIRIKSNGGLFVENTLNSDAQLNVFKSSGDDANHARLRVGYDESNCWEVSRKRNSSNVIVDSNQSGSYVYHRTEGKDVAIITPSQVFATAKHASKVTAYSGINSGHWGEEAVKKFYASYYTGVNSATYHVARLISQTDWGFANLEIKVAKYQYQPTSDDLHTKQFTTYYGGHSSRISNYNQQSSGSGTGAWNVLNWRQDLGPGGSHQVHASANGGYYRDCYGSDIYVDLGVYTGIRLEFTVWANTGTYDRGNYATAQDFYPAAFGGQASQTDADNWNGPRGMWFDSAPNGTGQGTNYGLMNFSTGVVYGEAQI